MITTVPHMVDPVKTTIGGLLAAAYAAHLAPMSDQPFRTIGDRLAAIRTGFSDLGQGAWAEKNGFNVTQYNNWERGVRRIPLEAAEKLAETYGLTLDFVYRGRRDGLSDKAAKSL